MKSDVRVNANAGEAATDQELLRIGMGGENYCFKQDGGRAFRPFPLLIAKLFTSE